MDGDTDKLTVRLSRSVPLEVTGGSSAAKSPPPVFAYFGTSATLLLL